MEADFKPKLAPRGGQEGEVGAKMAASWGQERAKRSKRRLEKRSWNEKSDFENCHFSLGICIFCGYRAAKWRQVGDKNWKDEVNIAKGEANMEQRTQEAAKI